MPHSSSIDMRLICGENSLLSIADEWQALLDDCIEPPLMLEPAWLLRWWRYYGADRELRIGQFFKGDTCIGIAPLCLRTHRYRGGLSFQRLEFMGAEGQDEDAVASDYLNLIARPGFEVKLAATFTRNLCTGRFGGWHELVLDTMSGGNPMTGLLRETLDLVAPVGGLTVEQVSQAPYLPLTGDWDGYLNGLSKKRRYRLRKALTDFEAHAGEQGYRLHKAVDETSLQTGMAILEKLHRERWQAAGHQGAFGSQRWRAFHQDYARHMLHHGKLLLAWVSIGEEPVAALYQFIGQKKVYFYQSGRKMDLPASLQPGIAMLALSLRECMEQDLEEYDFLPGAADYKKLFTRQTRPIMRIRLARRSGREWLRRGFVYGRSQLLRLSRRPGSPTTSEE